MQSQLRLWKPHFILSTVETARQLSACLIFTANIWTRTNRGAQVYVATGCRIQSTPSHIYNSSILLFLFLFNSTSILCFHEWQMSSIVAVPDCKHSSFLITFPTLHVHSIFCVPYSLFFFNPTCQSYSVGSEFV